MQVIEITVEKQHLKVRAPCELVAGTVGLYGVKVTYDEEWGTAPLRLIQVKGCEEIELEDTGEVIKLPHECIKKPCYLKFGLIGMDGNGKVRITTYSDKASTLDVRPRDWRDGTGDEEMLTPTPNIWEQRNANHAKEIEAIEQAHDEETSALNAAHAEEIATLNSEIARKQTEIKALQEQVEALENESGDNAETIATLQEQIAAKQAEIAALEQQIAALEQQIAELNTSLADINAAINEKTGNNATYEPSEMGGAIRGIVDYLSYATNLGRAFYKATFPHDEVVINVPNLGNETDPYYSLQYAFSQTKGAKKITLKGNVNKNILSLVDTFSSSSAVIIDISDISERLKTISSAFSGPTLEEIIGAIGFPEGMNVNSPFNYTYYLEEIRFVKNTLTANIGFPHSSRLSNESIQSIIDGLADLTGATQQTITFHTNVADKLTTDQVNAILAKNWNIG